MGSDDLAAAFSALEEVPILHYYGHEIVTLARRFNVQHFGQTFSKMDIEECLKQSFTSKKQLILWPFNDGNTGLSLEEMPFELLDSVVLFKPSVETSAIVGPHNRDEYEAMKNQYLTGTVDERPANLMHIKDFILPAVLENLAANIHKGFASYFSPDVNLQLLLLDNRKVYSTDKVKIKQVESKLKKQQRSSARANLPHISDTNAESDSILKSSAPMPQRTPAGKPRRRIEDSSSSSESGYSSSEILYPVEGKHTSSESEPDGNETPVLLKVQPPASPTYMTSAGTAMMASAGPLAFATPPLKRQHKSKAPKKTSSSRSSALTDDDSKPSAAEKRKMDRKDKKKRSKKSKKHSKRSKKSSSSSSEASSDEASEDDKLSQEQVFPLPFLYILLSYISPLG